MGWEEVKKINKDIKEPLNYLLWINDITTYGKEGYVLNRKETLLELLNESEYLTSSKVAMDVLEGIPQVWEDFYAQTTGMGRKINRLFRLDCQEIENAQTTADIVNSKVMLTALSQTENGRRAITSMSNVESIMLGIASREFWLSDTDLYMLSRCELVSVHSLIDTEHQNKLAQIETTLTTSGLFVKSTIVKDCGFVDTTKGVFVATTARCYENKYWVRLRNRITNADLSGTVTTDGATINKFCINGAKGEGYSSSPSILNQIRFNLYTCV